jgi:hypothetical protein
MMASHSLPNSSIHTKFSARQIVELAGAEFVAIQVFARTKLVYFRAPGLGRSPLCRRTRSERSSHPEKAPRAGPSSAIVRSESWRCAGIGLLSGVCDYLMREIVTVVRSVRFNRDLKKLCEQRRAKQQRRAVSR